MSGGGGGRVLDCQSAPVNVRSARATAGSQTNYPDHHGAQDVSLRIALLLFRHSKRDTVSCQEFGDEALRVLPVAQRNRRFPVLGADVLPTAVHPASH